MSALGWPLLASCAVLGAAWIWPKQLVPAGRRFVPRKRKRRGQDATPAEAPPREEELQILLAAVISQLSAGADPAPAWTHGWEVLFPDRRPLSPSQLAQRAPNSSTRTIAAAWALAEEAGAPLSETLRSVQTGILNEVELNLAIKMELAGPQATIKILLGLPIVSLLLGELIGAHPLRVLVMSNTGRLCLLLGLVFLLFGHIWMRFLVRQVKDSGRSKIIRKVLRHEF